MMIRLRRSIIRGEQRWRKNMKGLKLFCRYIVALTVYGTCIGITILGARLCSRSTELDVATEKRQIVHKVQV